VRMKEENEREGIAREMKPKLENEWSARVGVRWTELKIQPLENLILFSIKQAVCDDNDIKGANDGSIDDF
jgi:hypothetical protein